MNYKLSHLYQINLGGDSYVKVLLKTYTQNYETKQETLFDCAKVQENYFTSAKRPTFGNCYGLKAVWRKNLEYRPQFFFKIRKAVCLGFVYVPK